MSLRRYFSFHYDDEFKPARQIVHTLLDIVPKGGNLALNITPRPDGALPTASVHILRQLGGWLAVNGEGIYHTSISQCRPERGMANTYKENCEYAFWLFNCDPVLPPRVLLDIPFKASSVRLLRTGEAIPFSQEDRRVWLDTSKTSRMGMEYAECFAVERQK